MPVSVTLSVIGGKWKPLILYVIQEAPRVRFNEMHRQISGITQKMLTQQVRELERDGLVHREVYPEVPPRVEYSITEYGKTMTPVLDSMWKWGEKHKARHKVAADLTKQMVEVK